MRSNDGAMPPFHPGHVAVVVPLAAPPASDLAARVRAWRAQVGVQVEVILVDATPGGLAPVPGARLLRERCPGAGRALRRALEITQAPWIAWADPRTQDHPKRFRRQVDALRRSGKGLCTVDLDLEGGSGRPGRLAVDLGFDEPPGLWHAGVLLRRERAASMGSAAFWPVELELYRRLRRAEEVVHLPEALVCARSGDVACASRRVREDAALLGLPRYRGAAPELSVVVATRNRREALLACLEGFSRQLLPAGTFELLVLDAGSRDGTAELLSALELPVPLRTLHRTRGGENAVRARALELARGSILLFAGDDTVPFPDTVRRHLEAHRQFAGRARAAIGSIESAADELLVRARVRTALSPGPPEAEPGEQVDGLHFTTRNASVSRAALERAGGFDPAFLTPEGGDADLGVRLERTGCALVHRPECRLRRRGRFELDGFSRHQRDLARDAVRFFVKHRDRLARSPLRELTRAGVARRVAEVAPALGEVEDAARGLIELGRGGRQAFGPAARDELTRLLGTLGAVRRDQGHLEGLTAHGLEGLGELLDPWRIELPPAEGGRVLLRADPLASPRWFEEVEAWLAVHGTPGGESRDGSTLVVWANPEDGLDAEDVGAVLAPILERARRDACSAPVVVLATEDPHDATRVFASVDAWIGFGTVLERNDARIAAELGVPRVDPVSALWRGRDAPWRFATEAPVRLLAWPLWRAPRAVGELLDLLGPLLARRDVCVVGLVDPSGEDPTPGLAALAERLRAGDWRDGLELVLEAPPEGEREVRRLARAVDGVLLPRGVAAPRAAYLESLCLPVLRGADDVAELLARVDRARGEISVVAPAVGRAPSRPAAACAPA